MAELFDFNAIKDIVDSKHPSSVILLDTNVLMDNPDPTKWQTDLRDPLIVIAWCSFGEIARLKDKKDASTQQKARDALKGLLWISDQGQSSKGIHVDNVGWLITLKLPSSDILEPELNKLLSIKEMCHGTDTTLLLIHRELVKCFPNLPIISFTGDQLYTVLGRDLGYLVHNSQKFPATLSEYVNKRRPKLKIDPDKELDAAIKRIEAKAIKVDLTLTGKRLDKNYIFDISDDDTRQGAIIAEGYGNIYHPEKGVISFLWSLPHRPGPSKNLVGHSSNCRPDIYFGCHWAFGVVELATLDYLGRENEVPDFIDLALISKISELADFDPDEGLPTLHSPICLAEHLMKTALAVDMFENENRDKHTDLQVDELLKRLYEKWEDEYVFGDYNDFRQFCIINLKESAEANISSFLDRIFAMWNIGYKVSFTLPPSYAVKDDGAMLLKEW